MSTTLIVGIFSADAASDPITSGYYKYVVDNQEATITVCNTSISGKVTIPSSLGGYPVTESAGGCYFGQDGNMLTDTYVYDSIGKCYVDENGYWDGKYIEE